MNSFKTIPESFEALEEQVNYLAMGTNPIVFFPPNTMKMPKLPIGMRSVHLPEGNFYFNPRFLTEELLQDASKKGMTWAFMGYAQKKQDALKAETVITVTVRNMNGKEIKSAIVDSSNEVLLKMQAYIFSQWFPNCPVSTDTVFNVIAERLVGMGVING